VYPLAHRAFVEELVAQKALTRWEPACEARGVSTEDEIAPATALRRLLNGYQVSQAVHAAAMLGIPDLLADGARTPDELAPEAGADSDALRRLLRALAAVGVLHEDEDDRFSLTQLGDCLRRDSPDSLAAWAVFVGSPHHWTTWGHLLDGIRSGENVFKSLHGVDVWQYRAEHEEERAVFDAAMVGLTRRTNVAILEAFDFGRFRTLVDIGGGLGTFVAGVLAAYPLLQGILFDQPHVVAGADDLLRDAGVADRCRVATGSFFDSVPEGGDAYLLKSVLHDWADEESVAILRACRRAIVSDGRLLVVERVVGRPNEGADTKFSDLNMLVMPGGRERTLEEFALLFEAAGFRLEGETPTASGFSVIEATPSG
jgi:hypothetical protein